MSFILSLIEKLPQTEFLLYFLIIFFETEPPFFSSP